MKTIVFIIVSFVLIIGLGIFYTIMVERQCNDMISQLDEISVMIQRKDWRKVSANLDQEYNKWQETRKIWHTLTDHTNIDFIDESIVKLISLTKAQNTEDCLTEIAVLKQRIHSVHAREKVTLSNIF